MTKAQIHIMKHSLGLADSDTWNGKETYRNHFCASAGHDDWDDLQLLCQNGMMRISRKSSELSGGDTVFSVTELGKAAIK